VVALATRDQLREIQRLHESAGVSSSRHHVEAGHPIVRKIATTGTPVPPRPALAERRPRPASAPPRTRRGSGHMPRSSDRRPAGARRRRPTSGGQAAAQ
jgi:hypothetical protein